MSLKYYVTFLYGMVCRLYFASCVELGLQSQKLSRSASKYRENYFMSTQQKLCLSQF